MPRLPRVKDLLNGAWYHIHASVGGPAGYYPLSDPLAQHKLKSLIQFYAPAYFCGVAAFQLMGNHYHLVMRFDPLRELTTEEFWERALLIYPNSMKMLDAWPAKRWQRLSQRLFDVSEFMRNVQAAFTRWYNSVHERKGHLWGARFKSNLLYGPEAVLEAVLYVELNAVRAGLAVQPEEYSGGSLHHREIGQDKWLLPLTEFLPEPGPKPFERFKELIYHRGAVVTKPNQKPLSPEVLERERARGFAPHGVYRKRLRYFSDSVVLGGELLVREKLAQLRQLGHYLRRKNPLAAEHGALFRLREQRGELVFR